jgi:hypothetical protein
MSASNGAIAISASSDAAFVNGAHARALSGELAAARAEIDAPLRYDLAELIEGTDAVASSATTLSVDAPRRVDWSCVREAAEKAAAELGWSARIAMVPERGCITVGVPQEETGLVARTTLDFYTRVEGRVGVRAFSRVQVEFTVC